MKLLTLPQCVALPFLIAVVGVGHAGRPLATEDADVLASGECEWESYAARETASGQAAQSAWSTQVGCGFGAASQLALGVGRVRAAGARAEAVSLGGKTALNAAPDGGVAWALAWGFEAGRERGGSFAHEGTQLLLVASRAFADGVTGHANLGWARSESARQSSTLWNLAGEWALGDGFDVLGEVYGDDRSRPWVGAGLRWQPDAAWSVDASYSVQTQTPRVRLLTLGFKLGF